MILHIKENNGANPFVMYNEDKEAIKKEIYKCLKYDAKRLVNAEFLIFNSVGGWSIRNTTYGKWQVTKGLIVGGIYERLGDAINKMIKLNGGNKNEHL